MSEQLKDKLQQRLARARSAHQELITPASPPVAETTTDQSDEFKAGRGRPKKIKRKVTTLYFDEDLDKALEWYLMQHYIRKNEKISKSEWIRGLVETSLRERGAWPMPTLNTQFHHEE